MKKFLALLLALVMALSLAACGGNNTPADDQQGDNNGDSQYPEYFAGMEDLIADAQAEGELVVRVSGRCLPALRGSVRHQDHLSASVHR